MKQADMLDDRDRCNVEITSAVKIIVCKQGKIQQVSYVKLLDKIRGCFYCEKCV